MIKVPKKFIEGALYYVTSRGDNNEEIFRDVQDYKTYAELLKKYKEQYGFKLFAFCLIPSHLHLLIELKAGLTISDIMHDLNANYTKYFNSKYERKGHLFQERFKLVLVEKETHLLEVASYIHLNPKILNIVKEPELYPYCSFANYLGKPSLDINISSEIEETKKYLKNKDHQEFIKEFSLDRSGFINKELNKKTVLGTNGFIEKVELEVEKYKSEIDSSIPDAEFKRKKRFFLVTGALSVIALIFISVYFSQVTFNLKRNLQKEMLKKQGEINLKLAHENSVIIKNLDEKYRADKVSLEAMQRRLAIEKEKTKQLEEKLNVPNK
ncbi:MAG: transposase [Candidatus Omnitrophica bacterium]|nr:transposase [Candidatus Omnitrophota bacterium]